MRKRVIVAMSGGVDSSIAIYLLQKQGYDVCGITMQLCQESDHLQRAQKVAKKFNIEHRIIDIKKEFQEEIIDYFSNKYIIGHTPNPCLQCNRLIKFGKLFDIAVKEDSYFATGHYAQISYNPRKDIYLVKRAKDKRKDQSYVLYMLDQVKLKRIILPLADKTKDQIKLIAKQIDLPIDINNESQDICFIPDGDYAGYIKQYMPDFKPKPGKIIDSSGNVLGTHKGIIFYTIGQRKGLGIAHSEPLFVIGINPEENIIIAGTVFELYNRGCIIKNIYFAHPVLKKEEFFALVKIRYHHSAAYAKVIKVSDDRYKIEFEKPQKSITAGQGAVFYLEDCVIGGGIIDEILP